MSTMLKNQRINDQGPLLTQEDKMKLYNMSYDNTTVNVLNNYYNKDDVNKFMKKIDKLNINFLILSDKYIKQQTSIDKLKDNLFLNLFKQISIYVEEIERLNVKIREREGNARAFREANIRDLTKEVNHSRVTIKALESKLSEKSQNEEKLKKEVASYKRQLTFYKDKLKLDLASIKEKKNIFVQVNLSYQIIYY